MPGPVPAALLGTLGVGAVVGAVVVVLGLGLLWAIRVGGAARQREGGGSDS